MINEQKSTNEVASTVTETAGGLYDTAKSTVGQAYGAATKRATSALNEQKGTLAEGLTTVAESVRQVGENLSTAPENNAVTQKAARYSDTIARKIENVSGYFERKDVGEMVRDAEKFARSNPAYFIAGAVVLGFVAARFLKSSNVQRALGETNSSDGGGTITSDVGNSNLSDLGLDDERSPISSTMMGGSDFANGADNVDDVARTESTPNSL